VVGRDGVRLSERWAHGLRTYHGLFSHGFPNVLFMGLTQTGSTISVPHMLQEQAEPEDRRSAIGSGIFQPSTQFFDWLEQWRQAHEFEGLTLGAPSH